jgi:hypothetical protein
MGLLNYYYCIERIYHRIVCTNTIVYNFYETRLGGGGDHSTRQCLLKLGWEGGTTPPDNA